MVERTRWIDTGSGPGQVVRIPDTDMPVMADHPPIAAETIRTAIHQVTDRATVPIALRIDDLADRLRGHLGLLLKELGPPEDAEDYELRCMLREADVLVRCDLEALLTRRERWEHVGILAASTKGLLRRYEDARP